MGPKATAHPGSGQLYSPSVAEQAWPGSKATRLVTAFGTDPDGELYFTSLNGGL